VNDGVDDATLIEHDEDRARDANEHRGKRHRAESVDEAPGRCR
jgi:hypothetical protein